MCGQSQKTIVPVRVHLCTQKLSVHYIISLKITYISVIYLKLHMVYYILIQYILVDYDILIYEAGKTTLRPNRNRSREGLFRAPQRDASGILDLRLNFHEKQARAP